ncbi:MAG: DNA polymerase III subunit gamma/tau [Spirochaetota bacterium]|nr:DNA polymerase III subunit gamma/tau [Spirochaetota bacterium]
MTYQVTARKWRPQNFDEIVFQDHISKTIRNSIKKGRVSHAYLFSGPRGVGKTTMARIIAKALNCIDGPTEIPCGRCENCIETRDGSSFDVIEIDGASNRGIDDIKELRENVNFAPIKFRYKVYIIDEVHMLTKEAFNALLKTLEEPPAHVVFIFATTEIHQIPETILSRCQKYQFKKIPIKFLVNHLKLITEKDGYFIDEKALFQIARASDGSMRDAQSLMDQLVSFSEGNISEDDALAILGIVPIDSFLNLLDFVSKTDSKEVINEIDRVASLGVDVSKYVAGFIDILRTIRLVRHGVSVDDIYGFSDDEMTHINKVADMFCDEDISVFFRIISDLENELKYSTNERICLEMALLDMINIKKRPSVAALIQKFDELYNSEIEFDNSSVNDKKSSQEVFNIKSEKIIKTEEPVSMAEKIRDKFHGQIIE